MSFERIQRHIQAINILSRSLIGRPAFEDIHVLLPDSTRPEPGFMRATSWLYCLYFEGGLVSMTFLRRLGEASGLVDRDTTDKHVDAVRCLRTELHHNLGFADSDQQARTAAELWRRKACGTAVPHAEEQWRQCYERLVGDAGEFLHNIENVVRRIEANGDNAENKITDWKRRLDRSWPAAAFDLLVEDAKFRLGRHALKSVAFRNRHIDRWRRQLELLEDGFDFELEATLIIEKTLLDEGAGVLPITGRDIIEYLQIEPGSLVGSLLEEAKRFFEAKRCSKEDIIAHLRNYLVLDRKAFIL